MIPMTVDRSDAIAAALTRLRGIVLVCGLLVATAILVQVLTWGMTAFTDMRYAHVSRREAPQIVTRADPAAGAVIEGLDAPKRPPPPDVPSSINRIGRVTKLDLAIRDAYNLASAVGSTAVIVLLPMLLLATLIGVVGQTPGIERAASSLIWAILLALFTIPMSGFLDLSWQQGIFGSAADMINAVEDARADYGGSGRMSDLYTRYAVLPIACLIGSGLLVARFMSAVEAGLVSEAQRPDLVLDREASRVAASAGSLHGGRSSALLQRSLDARPAAAHKEASDPAPRRLI